MPFVAVTRNRSPRCQHNTFNNMHAMVSIAASTALIPRLTILCLCARLQIRLLMLTSLLATLSLASTDSANRIVPEVVEMQTGSTDRMYEFVSTTESTSTGLASGSAVAVGPTQEPTAEPTAVCMDLTVNGTGKFHWSVLPLLFYRCAYLLSASPDLSRSCYLTFDVFFLIVSLAHPITCELV